MKEILVRIRPDDLSEQYGWMLVPSVDGWKPPPSNYLDVLYNGVLRYLEICGKARMAQEGTTSIVLHAQIEDTSHKCSFVYDSELKCTRPVSKSSSPNLFDKLDTP